MARTNTYTCHTCGKIYDFCLKCQFTRPDYDAEVFCCAEHAKIHAILSKHGCNLISADEALKDLAAYNLGEITLTEDVAAHIEKIKAEATPVKYTNKVEEPVVQSTVKQSNKNSKKKW